MIKELQSLSLLDILPANLLEDKKKGSGRGSGARCRIAGRYKGNCRDYASAKA